MALQCRLDRDQLSTATLIVTWQPPASTAPPDGYTVRDVQPPVSTGTAPPDGYTVRSGPELFLLTLSATGLTVLECVLLH